MARRATWVLGLAAALAVAGCGSPAEPEPDTAPPAVVRTEPIDGASEVDPSAKIRVWFDEAVDNQRIAWDDALHLVRADGASLYGNGSYDLELHQATLSLAMELLPGQVYRAVIERGVCDLAGNCMAAPVEWSFTVAP